MNYDRVIVELLDRISLLEEKTERLEKIIAQQSSSNVTGTDGAEPKTRDKTKYIIDGRTCLKNRLVLEVVKKYVSEHSEITFDRLRDVFYDKLQGSFGVVRMKSDIEQQKQIRYFYKDEDTITLDDGAEVVVSNQWGKDNIKAFVVLAKSFGYEIQEV
jgi:hypothetical protein